MDFMKAFMDQNMIAMMVEIVLFANTVTMAMPTHGVETCLWTWCQSFLIFSLLEAKKYPETLKVFTNTALAESWEEQGHTIEGDPLLRRRELYPYDAPEGVLVITCAVDVQGDRLELEFRGWGVGEQTWGLAYEVLTGDPSTKASMGYIGSAFRTNLYTSIRTKTKSSMCHSG